MSSETRDKLLAKLASREALLENLERQCNEARSQIALLRQQAAAEEGPPAEAPVPTATREARDTPLKNSEKLKLFRQLFRGREDVFPLYWENPKRGKNGYSPACANRWASHLCRKREVKCGECPERAFVAVSDRVILDHLKGRHVIGVYPMLEDETCWFLAADFDDAAWQDDVSAFVETCRTVSVQPSVERSRSGNGAHVWFFFAEPVAASVARRMGCYLITETMARRHQLGMQSYDRLFPNQDTMPRGGFGNLIALPFQDEARQRGNTLFVDDALTPLEDQWDYLSRVPRLKPEFVEGLAQEASRRGLVIGVRSAEPLNEEDAAPWTRLPSGRPRKPLIKGPLPSEVRAVLAQRIFVDKAEIPSPLLNQIKRLAAFQNPEFYKKQSMRLSTRGTPRVISCSDDLPLHLTVPRGCRQDLEDLLGEHGVRLALEDHRNEGEPVEVSFHGQLTSIQHQAAQALLRHDTGIFVAPPGIGKTVLGTYLVAKRKRSTLVLVHRQQLLDQWLAQLAMFLGVGEKEIGQIGGGKKKPNGRLDVAMLQSLARKGSVDDRVAGYGHVIVDECHHLPAFSFERVLSEVKAKYIVGLTATPQRRDGHQPITEMQLGPARFSINAKSQAAQRPFDHRLVVRETAFVLRPDLAQNTPIQTVYRELAHDEARNRLILDDVIRAIQERRSPILLTERKDHLEYFADHLKGFVRHVVVLQGGMTRKERNARVQRLENTPDTEERLLLATGRYIGEGFDDARLDTLFLALPIAWKGTLVQYAGRLHRLHPKKTEVRIFDYVDRSVPTLLRMFEKRLRGYRAIGYARGEAPLGFAEPSESRIVEYDDEILASLDRDEDLA